MVNSNETDFDEWWEKHSFNIHYLDAHTIRRHCYAAGVLEGMIRRQADIDDKQTKIDALMLEWCPDDMTPEQLAEWAKNQAVSDVVINIEDWKPKK